MTGNSLRGILNIKSMLLNMNIQKLKWIRSTLMEIRGTGCPPNLHQSNTKKCS